MTVDPALPRSVDVVVVGGGNAGFTAAHAAASRGRSVLLLERGEEDEAGGNSWYTAGATRISHAGLDDLRDIVEPDERHDLTEVPPYPAEEYAADLAKEPRLVRGYIGPQLLAEIGVRYVVDPLVVPGSAWVTGANEPDKHAAFVVRGRDFEPTQELGAVEIRDGDRCARCGGELSIARGIEIGHIFQLGRKFADAFGLDAQAADGEPIVDAPGPELPADVATNTLPRVVALRKAMSSAPSSSGVSDPIE